jgi:CRISPR-associated protein Csx10
MTHVAINPARETAERGLLYSVQVIAEGTRFLGRVGIPEEWDQKRVEEFKELLAGVRFIGARRSQGLGRVETRISEEWPELESLVTRIEAFNEKLGEVRRSYAGRDDVPADSAGKGYFSVDLATPAILSGNDGCPKLELTPAILAAEAERLGFPGLPQVTALQLSISPGDERSVFFVEAETIGGWSPAWGLPKPTAPAAAAGSVFVFRATDLPKLCEALAAVEGRGIGLRREEGFGKVRICDPIHMEVRPI